MTWGNCVSFAVRMYLRRVRKGKPGYILLRCSRLAKKTPHLMYGEWRNGRIRVVGFAPAAPKKRLIPPLFFAGRVVWGD